MTVNDEDDYEDNNSTDKWSQKAFTTIHCLCVMCFFVLSECSLFHSLSYIRHFRVSWWSLSLSLSLSFSASYGSRSLTHSPFFWLLVLSSPAFCNAIKIKYNLHITCKFSDKIGLQHTPSSFWCSFIHTFTFQRCKKKEKRKLKWNTSKIYWASADENISLTSSFNSLNILRQRDRELKWTHSSN